MIRGAFSLLLFFVSFQAMSQTPFDPVSESDFVKATYTGGDITSILSQGVAYPAEAAVNGVEGNVVYLLKITSDGKIAKIVPKERISKDLATQVEGRINALNKSWTPTKLGAKTVEREYLIVFNYQIHYNALPTDYHAIAKKYSEKGKLDRAIRTYDDAIKENPYEPVYYTMRAQYKKEAGDAAGADSDVLLAQKMTMEVLAIVEVGTTRSLR